MKTSTDCVSNSEENFDGKINILNLDDSTLGKINIGKKLRQSAELVAQAFKD